MKKLRFILILLGLLVLVPITVQAIGITPSSITLNFEPNYETTLTFYASNNRDANTTLEPYFGGDLEKYIKILNPKPVNIPPGGYAEFKIRLRLPSALNTPGLHRTYIGVTEKPSDNPTGAGAVVAYTSAEALLDVKSPYPNKYATADLIVENVNVGETARFKINVENLGEKTINSAHGIITIEEGDKLIKQLTTIYSTVPTKEIVTLPVKVETKDMKPGEYKVSTVVDYDGLKATDEDSFLLGDLYVNLTNYTRSFEVNKINRWEMSVQNRWNKPIKSVYAEAKILQNGEEISIGARTPPISLSPWENNRLDAYWDTSGFAVGEYDAKITLFYEDKKTENLIKINIMKSAKPLLLQIPWLHSKISLEISLLLIILLVILVDLMWLALVIKRRKKDDKKK